MTRKARITPALLGAFALVHTLLASTLAGAEQSNETRPRARIEFAPAGEPSPATRSAPRQAPIESERVGAHDQAPTGSRAELDQARRHSPSDHSVPPFRYLPLRLGGADDPDSSSTRRWSPAKRHHESGLTLEEEP